MMIFCPFYEKARRGRDLVALIGLEVRQCFNKRRGSREFRGKKFLKYVFDFIDYNLNFIWYFNLLVMFYETINGHKII